MRAKKREAPPLEECSFETAKEYIIAWTAGLTSSISLEYYIESCIEREGLQGAAEDKTGREQERTVFRGVDIASDLIPMKCLLNAPSSAKNLHRKIEGPPGRSDGSLMNHCLASEYTWVSGSTKLTSFILVEQESCKACNTGDS